MESKSDEFSRFDSIMHVSIFSKGDLYASHYYIFFVLSKPFFNTVIILIKKCNDYELKIFVNTVPESPVT